MDKKKLKEYFKLMKQHVIKVMLEFIVTDSSGNVRDKLTGVVSGGTMNIDSGSSVRRTASLTMTPNKQLSNINEKSTLWLDKNVSINLQVYDNRKHEYVTFPMGIYLCESYSTSYDASTNNFSVDLSDWVLKLDGTVNGIVGGATTTILQAYDEDPETGEPLQFCTIKTAIERILKSAGINEANFDVMDIGEYYAMPQYNPEGFEEYRIRHPLWNMIPYDLEFSTGTSVWDMISECIELYPNYDAAFDETGKFIVKMIPSEYAEANDFEYEDYVDMVISEQTQTPLTGVKNVCEVWGESMDVDWYCDSISVDGNTYEIGLPGYGDRYRASNKIGITFTNPYENLYIIDFHKMVNELTSDTHNWKEIDFARYLNCVGLGGVKKIPITLKLFDAIWDFDSKYSHNPEHWKEPDVITKFKEEYGEYTDFYTVYNGFVSQTITSIMRYSTAYDNKSELLLGVNELSPLTIVNKDKDEPFSFADLDYNHINVFYVNKVKVGTENLYTLDFRNLINNHNTSYHIYTKSAEKYNASIVAEYIVDGIVKTTLEMQASVYKDGIWKDYEDLKIHYDSKTNNWEVVLNAQFTGEVQNPTVWSYNTPVNIYFNKLNTGKGEDSTFWNVNDFARFLNCVGRHAGMEDRKRIPITDELFEEILAYDDEHYHDPERWGGSTTEFYQYNKFIEKVKNQLIEADYMFQFVYLGIEQPHAIDVLANKPNIDGGFRDPYSGKIYNTWMELIREKYNCDNVTITIIEDSPFSVEHLGIRIDVKEGGEFDNINSNQLASERAIYENWKNSRLTDDVTITTKLMPFVQPYMKISYKKSNTVDNKDYIVKSVSHDFDNGTSTISMYTFYPLYRQKPGMNKRMTYYFMGGFHNEDLYGDQDASIYTEIDLGGIDLGGSVEDMPAS